MTAATGTAVVLHTVLMTRLGELTVGAVGDLVCWPQEGVRYAGALADPVEAWLRCGPVSAHHTVVAGKVLVRDGALTIGGVPEKLRAHAAAAPRIQGRGA